MKNRLQKATHLIIASILVVVVTALLILGMNYIRILPVAASAQAQPIDDLFHLELKVIAFLFSLIVVLMVYSIFIFRRKRGDTADAAHRDLLGEREHARVGVHHVEVVILRVCGQPVAYRGTLLGPDACRVIRRGLTGVLGR